MRVLQLIDSLDTGGAERVAVNIANALSSKVEGSFLCATRKEGILKESLFKNVDYLFLNKKKIIDLRAIKRLNTFLKRNYINVVHAHSSSFFLATIIKIINPKLTIIWHDHYGNSEFLNDRKYTALKICSKYFSHIFSVNKSLEIWSKEVLKVKNISFLPNFAIINKSIALTNLKGVTGKRIVCLANLRPQKDHITLLLAFKEVLKIFPDWTLHCVGKDFKDNYSKQIERKMKALELNKAVYLYDSKPDVFEILKQCDIGVLSSKSEGLPLALLEYGLAELPVIATKVGECETIISDNENGLLVDSLSVLQLEKALRFYIENKNRREAYAVKYNNHIKENYSKSSQIETILKVYKTNIK